MYWLNQGLIQSHRAHTIAARPETPSKQGSQCLHQLSLNPHGVLTFQKSDRYGDHPSPLDRAFLRMIVFYLRGKRQSRWTTTASHLQSKVDPSWHILSCEQSWPARHHRWGQQYIDGRRKRLVMSMRASGSELGIITKVANGGCRWSKGLSIGQSTVFPPVVGFTLSAAKISVRRTLCLSMEAFVS